MIPPTLRNLFLLSIPVFILHGLEEYIYGFQDIDPIFKFFFGAFESMTIPQATFLVFQIMLWLLLLVAGGLMLSDKWRLRMMILPGVVYLFEFHHFIEAGSVRGYYPGVITALAFPVIAFLYWKELIRIFSGFR